MAEQAWDRVAIDPQSIDAPLSRAAVFLVVTVADGDAALAKACAALDGLADLVKTVGFRDLAGRLSCIVGLGHDLWTRLQVEGRPRELKRFAPIKGAVHDAPATPATCCSTSGPSAPTCASNSSACCSTASAMP